MLLKLLQVGERVLRQNARHLTKVEVVSTSIQDLISSMHETLRDAPGVGLAAPQVGVPIQLAIIEDLPEYWREIPESELKARDRRAVAFHVIVNPRIAQMNDLNVDFFEGCLSLNGFTAIVPRASDITVECLDECGEPKVIQASGWYARILQHEIDHLNGTLYIDRMKSRTFMSLENYRRHWKDKPNEDLRLASEAQTKTPIELQG
jgi:peptide deformylase